MERKLRALLARHAIVEAKIQYERNRPAPDDLKLGSLKRIKLRLKDQIATLEQIVVTESAVPACEERSLFRCFSFGQP